MNQRLHVINICLWNKNIALRLTPMVQFCLGFHRYNDCHSWPRVTYYWGHYEITVEVFLSFYVHECLCSVSGVCFAVCHYHLGTSPCPTPIISIRWLFSCVFSFSRIEMLPWPFCLFIYFFFISLFNPSVLYVAGLCL